MARAKATKRCAAITITRDEGTSLLGKSMNNRKKLRRGDDRGSARSETALFRLWDI